MLLAEKSPCRLSDPLQKQLEKDRAAVGTLRDTLAAHPAVRKDLREV